MIIDQLCQIEMIQLCIKVCRMESVEVTPSLN